MRFARLTLSLQPPHCLQYAQLIHTILISPIVVSADLGNFREAEVNPRFYSTAAHDVPAL